MKRVFDIVVSAVLLIFLAPLILIVAFLVWKDIGRPVLFRQVRPGLQGVPFTLLKFRTMTDQKEAAGKLRPDAERLTRIGSLLRSLSLDELPTLYNVVKGDMSLVGPRPLLMDYLQLYNETQRRRHHVKPGVTGWAQINGRNNLSWERKFELDVWYVDHQSFLFDLKILFLTVWKVLMRSGISKEGHATTDRFMGSTGKAGEYAEKGWKPLMRTNTSRDDRYLEGTACMKAACVDIKEI